MRLLLAYGIRVCGLHWQTICEFAFTCAVSGSRRHHLCRRRRCCCCRHDPDASVRVFSVALLLGALRCIERQIDYHKNSVPDLITYIPGDCWPDLFCPDCPTARCRSTCPSPVRRSVSNRAKRFSAAWIVGE